VGVAPQAARANTRMTARQTTSRIRVRADMGVLLSVP
jgi:hypothetical protein